MINFLVLETSHANNKNSITDRFISYEDLWNTHWGILTEHPPISWHSYASAMSGRFVSAPLDNYTEHIKWADMILLTWAYCPLESLKILRFAKKLGKKVVIAFHENGAVINMLSKNLVWLSETAMLLNEADYILEYPHHEFYDFYLNMLTDNKTGRILSIKNSYPDELFKKCGPAKGHVALVGMQYKDNELENRCFMLNLSKAVVHEKVFVINSTNKDNKVIQDSLNEIFKTNVINVIPTTNNYYEFLELIDTVDVVYNNDMSLTQGQVSSDTRFMGKVLVDSYTEHSYEYTEDEQITYSYVINQFNNLYNTGW